jgi:hypothetical protein
MAPQKEAVTVTAIRGRVGAQGRAGCTDPDSRRTAGPRGPGLKGESLPMAAHRGLAQGVDHFLPEPGEAGGQ